MSYAVVNLPNLTEQARCVEGVRVPLGEVLITLRVLMMFDQEPPGALHHVLMHHTRGESPCGHEDCQRVLDDEIEAGGNVETRWEHRTKEDVRFVITTNPDRTKTIVALDDPDDLQALAELLEKEAVLDG